jgi:hypothetical protein
MQQLNTALRPYIGYTRPSKPMDQIDRNVSYGRAVTKDQNKVRIWKKTIGKESPEADLREHHFF